MLALALAALLARPLADTTEVPGLIVLEPRLAHEIHFLMERSPTFRGALLEIAGGAVPVFVGTPPQIRPIVPNWGDYPESVARALALGHREETRQADLTGSRGSRRAIRALQVLVVIDLDNLVSTYRELGADSATFRNDLAVILAHEIAGHARGWSRTGRIHDGCLDPSPADVRRGDVTGCAVDVENEVRRELGLPLRVSYEDDALGFGHAGALELAYDPPSERPAALSPAAPAPRNPVDDTR